MNELSGTQTERNLRAAFAGEAQARCRYLFYAMQAQAEGHSDVEALFLRMEQSEREHATIWLRLLNEQADSIENLTRAANSENNEWKNIYPAFAQQAQEDGFPDIGAMFTRIASIEYDHERQFLERLLAPLMPAEEQSPKAVAETDSGRLNETSIGATQPGTAAEKPRPAACILCGQVQSEATPFCPICGGKGTFVS
ncbi:MAG: rubrerythrin family protein [Angelakisella sp.]